jgi:hemerythrin-like domain-containing protein
VTDPLERFTAEHREALTVLDRLERAAAGLRGGDDPAAHFAAARHAHAFLAGPVRRHNDSEELALFPLLGDDAPTGVFVEEHGRLRALERELAGAIGAGDAPRTAAVAVELADLLRAHIAREDEVLFPMARGLLGVEGLARVAARLPPA